MNKYGYFTATTILPRTAWHEPAPNVFWMTAPARGALLAEYSPAFQAVDADWFAVGNWDGEGALPVSPLTKQNAKDALKDILPVVSAPEISPNPSGTVSFEWETNEGKAHLEIGNTKYSFYVSPRFGNTIFHEGTVEDALRFHGNLVASLLYPQTNRAEAITTIRCSPDVRTAD